MLVSSLFLFVHMFAYERRDSILPIFGGCEREREREREREPSSRVVVHIAEPHTHTHTHTHRGAALITDTPSSR